MKVIQKVDVPTYDGKLIPKLFSNWLIAMEDYFDWYGKSNIKCSFS